LNNSKAEGTTEKNIFRWTTMLAEETDFIAVEEPLEIILVYETNSGRMERSVAVTMRTPGNDEELALGFLYTEKIIRSEKQVVKTELSPQDVNRVRVFLEKGFIPDIKKIQRNFYTSSSCGVCGRSSIDAVMQELSPVPHRAFNISASMLQQLSDKVQNAQSNFQRTGGIHAAALFDLDGKLLLLKEDVGRHNAMDKLSGAMLKAGFSSELKILFLSGRTSFELMQKAAIMKIPVVVSVGAPSSLAIEIAEEQNILLAGFLRKEKFNVYHHQKDIHNFIK
jgi:FdhD protein